MAGGRTLSSIPSDLLHRIKGFVRSLVDDLCNDRPPSVALDRYRNYCSDLSERCTCSYDLPNSKEIISIEKGSHRYRLDVLLTVLLIIQQLLQENKHGSKRDIYYMHPGVFLNQAAVDQAINDICILLKCSRHHLNVVPVGKGLVMGWLRFSEAGRKICCINNPSTGRGYPDVSTRRFLRHIVDKLLLPVYCLVDYDPYGFDILSIYRFGSMQMAYDANLMRVPTVRWLGVFRLDLDKYHLPDRCLLKMTSHDKERAKAMLVRCYLSKEAPQWRKELEIMLQKGMKFEIEALSSNSLSFLSEYIPEKIHEGSYI